jgi:hypothetical protein
MNIRRDFIPESDRSFLSWITNFLKNLFPVLSRTNFPPDEYQKLTAQRDDFAQKFEMAGEPATRTSVAVEAKNSARKLLEVAVRVDVKAYLTYNPHVTDEDRIAMGLPIHKTTRTRVPMPEEKPDFSIKSAVGSRLEVHYHAHDDEKGKTNAKPYGVRGVEIVWAILDAPPASYADLVHSTFDTHSPYTFQFDLSDAGKRIYICLRWENTRAEKGPWSEIQNAIIP